MSALIRRLSDLIPPSSSLAGRTLLRAAVRITLVVLIASVIGYRHVRGGMETQALDNLERYVDERRARESQTLEAAEASLGSLAQAFHAEWRDARNVDSRFERLFVERADGTRRTTRDKFERTGVSGFVGKYAPLSAQDKRTLLVGYELLDRVGPALRDRFRNAYLVTANNAVLMYWPDQPWALDVADWEIFAKLALARSGDAGDVLVVGGAAGVENERARWSKLYFDYGVNEWLTSVTKPLVENGRLVASLGHDLLVDDLIERVVRSDIDGAYNLLMDREGELIAHPRFMSAIKAHGGAIEVERAGDPLLIDLLRVARDTGNAGAIVDLPNHDLFVASTTLEGPDWSLMTVFPKAIIASSASEVAWLIMTLGIVALAVELLILSGVLRGLVGQPLQALADAADRVRHDPARDFHMELRYLARHDELGRLSRAFSGMVTQLRERHAELMRLNGALQRELEQRQHAELELERHRELNALLDTIDYGVLFLDRDLRSRLANTAYRQLWHSPPGFYQRSRHVREDMEESRRAGLYPVSDEDWPDYLEGRLEAIRRGAVGPEELRLQNGTILIYRCTPLPDGGRMLTYFDITELKRVEAALRTHLEGMEASMDGMALLDDAGRFTYVNRAHAEIYGFERDAMIGRSWTELYDETQLDAFTSTIMPVLTESGRWRGEATGRRRNGTRFPQELSLAATGNGGLVCVVRDITERKTRERALSRAVKHAEESNAAKSRFLASMSHELRTPLNAILGFTRIVTRKTDGQIEPRQRDNLAKIQVSADHLLRLINDVLDISKIEAGRTEVTIAPYSPALVAVECARTIEPILASEVSVVIDVSGVAEGCAGDAAKVRQILMNLLSNAARHTVSGSIEISAVNSGGRLRYAVRDSGSGIPEHALEAIFEEFGQARNQNAKASGGTGLGLTISRRLARLMGGDISVVSELARGSTFTLDLPFHPVDGKPGARPSLPAPAPEAAAHG